MRGTAVFDDVQLFLDELFHMLARTEASQIRRILEGDEAADNLKTVSAFRITGPSEVTAENTEDWIRERIEKNVRRSGQDWLAGIGSTVMPSSAKQLAFVAVGPQEFVVLSATTRKIDQIAKLKFKSPRAMLGSGWSLSPRYCAVSLPSLREHLAAMLSDAEDPAAPLGLRIIRAALSDRTANS